MSERGILFSDAMVLAILDGRKTQTRRVIKPQPTLPYLRKFECFDGVVGGAWIDRDVEDLVGCRMEARYNPYRAKAGARLWVREAWCELTTTRCDGEVEYRAGCEDDHYHWSPSIHMPRWASRITLEVVGVRVQRVQEISESDAQAEGTDKQFLVDAGDFVRGRRMDFDKASTHRIGFQSLWDSINAKRGFSWDVNPWVWVIDFRRLADPSRKHAELS